MHISTNIGVTVLMFLIVYGGYFIATYLSCKHMVMEKQIEELEVQVMPENVNWSAVWQSVTDTWIPLFGGIALIVVAVIVIHIIRKRKK